MSKLFWLGDNKSSVEEFSRCGLFLKKEVPQQKKYNTEEEEQ